MMRLLSSLRRNEAGTSTIEFTIVALLFFLITFGLVEFGYMFWQYNSAAKAAQVGARLAAISNPVWSDLPAFADTGTPGDEWETNYAVECSRDDASCVSIGADDVDDVGYDPEAMDCLVFGRATGEDACDAECAETGIDGEVGMCDRFRRLEDEGDIIITYSHTGMGFAGRPGGPVPTITLQLTGLTFEFFALGALMGFDEISMPDFKVTMTGEDLNRAAP
jgi:hypothetical protein